MNYQTIACFGDSLAFGARTYDCYPMILSKIMSERSQYDWRALNISENGATARSLWFTLNNGLLHFSDAYVSSVLIGTNDASNGSSPDYFEEYYRQIVRTLRLARFRVILCGTVPPFHCDGHAFFTRDGEDRRKEINIRIQKVVDESAEARLVDLSGVTKAHCVDPAHLNSAGNTFIAEAFAKEIAEI